MICKNCGTELPDNVKFCTECGAPVGGTERPATVGGAGTEGAGENAGEHKRRVNPLAVVAIVAAAVAAIALVILYGRANPTQEPATDAAETAPQQETVQQVETVQVAMAVVAPGYEPSTDSKIPLRLTGTDKTGAAVDKTIYVVPDDEPVEVEEGSYEIAVVASPLMASGQLYSIPEPVQVEVSADQGTSQTAPEIDFEVKSASDITQQDIDDAKAAAVASGYDSDKAEDIADSLSDTVTKAAFAPVIEDYLTNKSTLTAPSLITNGNVHLQYEGAFIPLGNVTILNIGVANVEEVPNSAYFWEIYALEDGEPKLIATYGGHDSLEIYDNGYFTILHLQPMTSDTYGVDDEGDVVLVGSPATDGNPIDFTPVPLSELAAEVGLA